MANLEKRTIGELECHVISTESPALLTAIFCHGFGAPGDDLVPVGAQLLKDFPELLDQVRFIFPSAPLSLDGFGIPGGRAWWPLDMKRMNNVMEQRSFEELRNEVPEQLPAAREKLLALIRQIQEEEGETPSQLILGGFSQGAMLATDVSLHLDSPPAAMAIWSGTLLDEEEWTQRAATLKGVPIVQSHGREDPILPYEAAIWLRDLLAAAGTKLNFIGFRGPHTIPRDAVSAVGQIMERLAGVIE